MKISIIVPVYNKMEYIKDCLNSIVRQSYKNIEIIIIDDGSIDGCGDICDEFANVDSRIIVKHNNHEGVVSSRKIGGMLATGDYIASVDGDDEIGEDYIKNFVDEIKRSGSKVIWSLSWVRKYSSYDEEWCFYTNGENINNAQYQEYLLKIVSGVYGFQNEIEYSHCNKCVDRNIYNEVQNKIPNNITHGEDFVFSIALLNKVKDIRFVYNKDYYYYQRPNSTVRTNSLENKKSDMVVFDYLRSIVLQKNYKLMTVVNGYYIRAIMLHSFNGMQKGNNYLWPFKEVKKNCKIIVYGAGTIGVNIVSYLKCDLRYKLVAWLDKNATKKLSINIGIVGKIGEYDYDYIILATNKTKYEREMILELKRFNVDVKKILLIDKSINECLIR